MEHKVLIVPDHFKDYVDPVTFYLFFKLPITLTLERFLVLGLRLGV